jgi:CheY-like chemotaxis protein
MSVQNGSASLAGLRVLIVEDESLVAMLLEDLLGDFGCEIAGYASRLRDAVEKAKTLSFDIAVLDVNLAGEHTFPVADILLRRGVPFVFVTGYGTMSLPESFQRAPLLQKPFQQHNLERALRDALDRNAGKHDKEAHAGRAS